MSKHDLENMIFNLEERKDLKKVEFTQKAVIEILGYLKQLADLEAKLAESESKLRVSNSLVSSSQLEYNQLKKEYDEQEKLLSKVLADKSNLQFEFDQLKQQVAEKEKEIETLKEENERNKAEAESQHKSFIDCFKDKMGLTLYYDNIEKQHNQNKISFCIKKLETIKDEIDNNAYFDYEHECNVVESYQLWSFVDTLIEELKKEMK